MRFLGIGAMAAIGLCVSGCDDSSGPTVNDSIAWIAKCAPGSSGCSQFIIHNQAAADQDFEVSCKRTSTGINFTIRDPGFKGDPGLNNARPAGQIQVANGNATQSRCNVTVREATAFGYAEEQLIGTCMGSGSTGSCTLTETKAAGWDWAGTLSCPQLVKQNDSDPNRRYTLVGSDGGAVQIALKGCGG